MLENITDKLNKKNKKEISEKESFDIIKKWGDSMEVRLNSEDFEDVQKELSMAVIKERLTFDEQKEEFIYNLRRPIEKQDESGSISILKIIDCDLTAKRDISKQKNEIDKGAEMFKAYCKDSEGEEIPIGFLYRIKTTDQNIINAVILGFFVQAIPG